MKLIEGTFKILGGNHYPCLLCLGYFVCGAVYRYLSALVWRSTPDRWFPDSVSFYFVNKF